MPIVKRPRARRRQPREWGRLTALALCIVFAVIGVIPLGLGLLVRTPPVRAWAARETARIIEGELGITARYEVSVQAFPLLVSLEGVVVDASDGGSPFLELERASVRPRIFALLAGQLDVGDIEVIGPRIRAVVEDGELKNLAFKLPQSKEESATKSRLPLSSVAITDARIDARIDATHVVTREVDVDVTVEENDAFEIALRAGLSRVTRVHPFPGREGEDSVDEDTLCRLDARVRLESDSVLIRRLTLQGSADFDPDPGTAPSCELKPGDWREIDVRLGALRVSGLKSKPIRANGRVRARLPLSVAHRFADVPYVTGSAFIEGEADYDGGEHLPRFTGSLELDQPGVHGKLFASKLKGELSTTTTAVRLANVDVAWADGKVTIGNVSIEPFTKGIPLTAGPIDLHGLEFPSLMRDLGAHPQAHVAWTFEEGHIESFKGTIQPLSLEGPMFVKTRGFEIFDRPTTDPQRGHMMSVREGTVAGVFQVREHGVVLSNFHIDTPQSHLDRKSVV